MTTPFPFVAGNVLTAAQLNSITELPTRTLNASGTAVAADRYSRVILDGSSITYTVPNSTFGTAEVIEIYNANATTGTVVAGAGVTINAAAGLTLAQWQTGKLYAISPSSFIFSKTDVTVSAGGLVYLTGASFTTATSFSLPNSTFTSTYRNYKIIIQLTALTADADFTIRMRASGTDDTNAQYDYAYNSVDNTGSGAVVGAALQTSWLFSESDSGNVRYIANIDVIAPQLATSTMFTGFHTYLNKANTAWVSRSGGGAFRTATQFDALSFISSVASSMTGVYRVYGYADA